jgi:hypothetical protein
VKARHDLAKELRKDVSPHAGGGVNEEMTPVSRLPLVAMLLLAALLLALNCLRAYSCGIEIDEADNYLLHLRSGLLDVLLMKPGAMAAHELGMPEKWGDNWQIVLAANNHVLNTLAIRLMAAFTGSSELLLRVPNLVAHAVYLSASFYICRSSSSRFYGFLMFALLNTNPFLLGWFALSRGYGLAVGFEMLAIAFLHAYIQTDLVQQSRAWRFQFGACLAGALAVLSHLTFSHFYLALSLVLPAIGIFRTNKRRSAPCEPSARGKISSLVTETWPLMLVSSLMMPIFFVQVTHMVNAGNWAVRVGDSFIDTVYSLAEKSLAPQISGMPPGPMVWTLVLLALGALAGATALMGKQAVQTRVDSTSLWPLTLVGMLVLCAAAQGVQHLLLRSPYWMERLALYFIPLYLLVLAELIRLAAAKMNPRARRTVVSGACLWVACFSGAFASSYSLKTIFYDYDQDARAVLSELAHHERSRPDRSRCLVLGASPDRDRCLEFYRQTRKITWLAPIIRNQAPESANFYFAANLQEVAALQKLGFIKAREFSSPESVLMKNPRIDCASGGS